MQKKSGFEMGALEVEKKDTDLTVSPEEDLPLVGVGDDFDGRRYEVYQEAEGVYFWIYADGQISTSVNRYGSDGVPVDRYTAEGQALMVKAYELKGRQAQILEARRQLAKSLAEGDSIKEKILAKALFFSGGKIPQPDRTIDGIPMYKVGGNASHDALLGTANGRLYLFSAGDETYLIYDKDAGLDVDELIENALNECVFKDEVLMQYVIKDDITNAFVEGFKSGKDTPKTEQDQAAELDAYIARKEEVMARYRSRFDAVLRPIIEEYLQSGRIPDNGNQIVIPRENEDEPPFLVYLTQELVDVTDEPSIYVGRGDSFSLAEEPLSPSVSTESN
jgi:hypothetical protein